jgi:dipeptidyl aminopeptidase/acylaminoacyl peptidase
MVVLLVVTAALVVLAALAAGGVGLMLYPPLPKDLGGAPNLDPRARRVRIPVGDADAIDGWYLPGNRDAAIIVFHGFGRTHHRAWRYVAFLERDGYHLLTVDFRSSRWNRRLPTTLGHHESSDAEAALKWLRAQPGLAGVPLGLFGESLGGAVSVGLAARRPDVAALVIDGAFASASGALEDACERWARLPRQPSATILRRLGHALTGADPGEMRPVDAAPALADRPVFLIHGLDDNRIGPAQPRALWTAAGAKDPLWMIPATGHNEGWLRHRAPYEQRVRAFFARHLLAEGPGVPAGDL